MGKKSRRARARAKAKAKAKAKYRAGGELVRSMPSERVHPVEPKPEPKPAAAAPSAEPALAPAQATRYQYVLTELRNIGIIAGVLFVILIVLTFILG